MTEQAELENNDGEEWEEARQRMLDALPAVTEPVPGGLAIDLQTRQLLFVRRKLADDLVTYNLEQDFDLLNYECHPYLPVSVEDAVYECVFLSDAAKVEGLVDWGGARTYDFPAGRLAAVPIQEAWGSEG